MKYDYWKVALPADLQRPVMEYGMRINMFRPGEILEHIVRNTLEKSKGKQAQGKAA